MKLVFRILLGVVFCASAISKLSSIESFELYIFSFKVFSYDLCSLAARLLIAAELILGLGLLSGFFKKTVNWTCALSLAAFSVFLGWRLIEGDTESCHCFGNVLDMNPEQSLLKNFALAALLAAGWRAPSLSVLLPWLKGRRVQLFSALAASAVTLFVVFAFWPPAVWWRIIGHSSSDLVEEKWQPWSDEFGFSEGRHLVLFVSPLCNHCQSAIARVDAMVKRHSLPKDRVHEVFMIVSANPADMPKLLPYFYEKAGIEDPGYDCRYIPADEFIPMTDGSMPLICLFDNGRLVKEFSKSTLEEHTLADFLLER